MVPEYRWLTLPRRNCACAAGRSITQKRKITDFLIPTTFISTAEGAGSGTREETGLPPLPKRNTHRQSFDPKWQDEFQWVIYNLSDEGSGKPSMLCRLCCKHNEMSSRMVCICIPRQLLRKDKLREHECPSATTTPCRQTAGP